MWEKIYTARHTHNNVNGRILVILSRCFTSVSDIIMVGDGVTFIHIFTNKIKNKIIMNTNFAFIPK